MSNKSRLYVINVCFISLLNKLTISAERQSPSGGRLSDIPFERTLYSTRRYHSQQTEDNYREDTQSEQQLFYGFLATISLILASIRHL